MQWNTLQTKQQLFMYWEGLISNLQMLSEKAHGFEQCVQEATYITTRCRHLYVYITID